MKPSQLIVLGWREWVALPNLGLNSIKAKVDTGARTSTVHAFEVEDYLDKGARKVAFRVHPIQHNTDSVVACEAEIIDQRQVSDSGGHKELRWIIGSELRLGEYSWPIELTLTARDNMLFRMLLGRTALHGLAIVDPARSYLTGKPGTVDT